MPQEVFASKLGPRPVIPATQIHEAKCGDFTASVRAVPDIDGLRADDGRLMWTLEFVFRQSLITVEYRVEQPFRLSRDEWAALEQRGGELRFNKEYGGGSIEVGRNSYIFISASTGESDVTSVCEVPRNVLNPALAAALADADRLELAFASS